MYTGEINLMCHSFSNCRDSTIRIDTINCRDRFANHSWNSRMNIESIYLIKGTVSVNSIIGSSWFTSNSRVGTVNVDAIMLSDRFLGNGKDGSNREVGSYRSLFEGLSENRDRRK